MKFLVELLQIGNAELLHNKVLFVVFILIRSKRRKNKWVLKIIQCFQFILCLLCFINLFNSYQFVCIYSLCHVHISKTSLTDMSNEFKVLFIHYCSINQLYIYYKLNSHNLKCADLACSICDITHGNLLIRLFVLNIKFYLLESPS